MIVGTIRIRVRREKRREFMQTMDALMDLLRALRGCWSYRFFNDHEDLEAFQLISEWSDFELFERHLTSTAFRVFRGSRPLLTDEPDAHLDFVSRRGLLDPADDWRCDA